MRMPHQRPLRGALQTQHSLFMPLPLTEQRCILVDTITCICVVMCALNGMSCSPCTVLLMLLSHIEPSDALQAWVFFLGALMEWCSQGSG